MKVMKYRRKREGKTDYKRRLALLKSGKPRLIIRKTLKNVMVQIANYSPEGDLIIASAHTNELKKKFGWAAGKKNMSSAYLTGLLCGKKAKDAKINEAVLDLGLQKSIKGSKLYATLKGVIDAGIKVPCSEEVFPTEDRINGKHIKEELAKAVEETKNKIIGK